MRQLFLLICLFLLAQCKESTTTDQITYQYLSGTTMGVVGYNITHSGEETYKAELDSLMTAINEQVSTYVPNSAISRFNQSEQGIAIQTSEIHFVRNLKIAKAAKEATQGTFDPTVMPLVNYWGFGYTPKEKVLQSDSIIIDSLIQLVGMEKITFTENDIRKAIPGMQLDFSASAKGYFVDEVALWLSERGVQNFMVEIGGEARTKGNNPEGERWRLGINIPSESADIQELFALIPLADEAIATSGNYRNYYTVKGITYSHTINPISGMPERSYLLSASIVTESCAYADAYATACMVMGLEKAVNFVERLEDVEGYFIYSDKNNELQTTATDGLANRVTRLNK